MFCVVPPFFVWNYVGTAFVRFSLMRPPRPRALTPHLLLKLLFIAGGPSHVINNMRGTGAGSHTTQAASSSKPNPTSEYRSSTQLAHVSTSFVKTEPA